MTLCYIALGSNLDNPLRQVQQAVTAIEKLGRLLTLSPWYASKAIGPGKQDDYINGVLALETSLSADALLQALQSIEQQQGRIRTLHWGARTLDLDILLFGDSIIEQEHLQVPHPRMKERNFVIYPLHDIANTLQLPTGESLAFLKSQLDAEGLELLTKKS